MASGNLLGYAIRRNGSCLASENDCGPKQLPYRACCPGQSSCESGIACCPTSGSNCSQTLSGNPGCGNKTWNLYNYDKSDPNGYFCCDPEARGYGKSSPSDSVGCAVSGAVLPNGAALLPIIQQGINPSTASSAAASSSTSSPSLTSSPTSLSPSSSNGGSNAGAIAGGIVGGVFLGVFIVGAIWVWRRKAKARAEAQRTVEYQSQKGDKVSGKGFDNTDKVEADASASRAEMQGASRAELGINEAINTPIELPSSPIASTKVAGEGQIQHPGYTGAKVPHGPWI